MLNFIFIFFLLFFASCEKKEEDYGYILQQAELLHFQQNEKAAFLTCKELHFNLGAKNDFSSQLLRTKTLDKLCQLTDSSIYRRYLKRDLDYLAPLIKEAGLQDQITYLNLLAHYHTYAGNRQEAKKAYVESLHLFGKLVEEISLQRSFIDAKALAFHQVKTDLRSNQMALSELYLEDNDERGYTLLKQAVVDKEPAYLGKRSIYLTNRLKSLEQKPLSFKQTGLTFEQFELLQTYRELHLLKKYEKMHDKKIL